MRYNPLNPTRPANAWHNQTSSATPFSFIVVLFSLTLLSIVILFI